jgi:hypothetical protein
MGWNGIGGFHQPTTVEKKPSQCSSIRSRIQTSLDLLSAQWKWRTYMRSWLFWRFDSWALATGTALITAQVVKEQAWFNEIILRLGNFKPASMENVLVDPNLTYDALQNTTYAPSHLRVSYSLVSDPEGRPGLRLQFGRPPPPVPLMEVEEETLPGLERILPDGTILPDDSRPVIVSVLLDSSVARGVRVEVDGRRVERFEEVVRRGGIVALPLKVRQWLAESSGNA